MTTLKTIHLFGMDLLILHHTHCAENVLGEDSRNDLLALAVNNPLRCISLFWNNLSLESIKSIESLLNVKFQERLDRMVQQRSCVVDIAVSGAIQSFAHSADDTSRELRVIEGSDQHTATACCRGDH
jgi:hypothetical protein